MSADVGLTHIVLDFTGNKIAGPMELEQARRLARYIASVRKEMVQIVPDGKRIFSVDDGERFYPRL